MDRNEKKNKGRYDSQTLISYHKKLVDEMLAKYGLPEAYHHQQIDVRKEFQVVSLETLCEKWEGDTAKRYLQLQSLREYKTLIEGILKVNLLPHLEKYYGAKIVGCHYFKAYDDNKVYIVKVFNGPLFKHVGADQGQREERIATLISGYICTVNDRGPEKISVGIIDNRFLVVAVSGLVCRFVNDYAYAHSKDCPFIPEILSGLIEGAVNYACQSEFRILPEKFTEMDFVHNNVTVLALLKSH